MTQYEDSDPLEGLTEEEIQQMVELGIIPAQQDALAGQLAQASAIRDRPMPEGRRAGRVFVASPAEAIVAGLQGREAKKEIEELRKRQEELLGRQVEGRTSYFQKFRGGPRFPGLGRKPPTGEGPV